MTTAKIDAVLVDGNNVSRKHNQATKLRSGGFETQAIFGCVKSARAMKVEYPSAQHTWLWDGRALWRYDIHPDYKSKRNLPDPRRDAERASHNAQKPFLTQALDNLGLGQMLCTAHEADDLAGIIIGNVKSKKPNALIQAISGDGDWVQLVREGVGVRDLNDDAKIYTLSNLMDKTGYRTPYAYLEGKCLHGDGSDDIPGVGGMARKVHRSFWLSSVACATSGRWLTAGLSNRRRRRTSAWLHQRVGLHSVATCV